MTDLVGFVFSVGGLVVFSLLAVLWFSARPHSKLARRVALIVMVFYALATVYATSFGLSRLLVAGFHPLVATDVPPGRTAIVVLGSGSYTMRDWSDNEYSTADAMAASRVLEAVRVYKLVKPDWVISSGGKRRPDDLARATGVAMSHLLLQLGVPADRVVTETSSRNTHDESVAVAAMLPKLNVEHLVLVTSEVHMRRAIGTFRAAGVRAIPAIVREPFPPRSWQDWVVPREEGLWGTSMLAHEILGIGYYAVRGWYRF
jgi:uncharacterized SAM-binding protein YcdF (DUF218 family)